MMVSSPLHVKCPGCGGRTAVPVAFGFPTEATRRAADRGELVLWGCVPPAPSWQCVGCGYENWDDLITGYAGLLRAAVGADSHATGPRNWSELGLPRDQVESDGLVGVDLPLVIRGYVTEESGWQEIDDEPADGAFNVGVTVLREDGHEARALAVGDLVMYLGQVKGCDGPMLWAPALVDRPGATAPRRRTAWTLTDNDLLGENAGLCVPLRELDLDIQRVVADVVTSGSPATPEQRAVLLGLFWR